MTKHKTNKHDIGVVWKYCSECEFKCKQNCNLKDHKTNKHDIDVVWKYCDLCEFKTKKKMILKLHKIDKHDIGVVWKYCSECEFKCKQKGSLTRHIENCHIEKTHGFIYKLSSATGKIFNIGSTFSMKDRESSHKNNYKRHLNGKSKQYHTAFEVLAFPDWRMSLLEKFECSTKAELEFREGTYQLLFPECNNKIIAGGLGILNNGKV